MSINPDEVREAVEEIRLHHKAACDGGLTHSPMALSRRCCRTLLRHVRAPRMSGDAHSVADVVDAKRLLSEFGWSCGQGDSDFWTSEEYASWMRKLVGSMSERIAAMVRTPRPTGEQVEAVKNLESWYARHPKGGLLGHAKAWQQLRAAFPEIEQGGGE